MCDYSGCRFRARHVRSDGGAYCGIHTRVLNRLESREQAPQSRAIVLPRCAGVTKRGCRCKRTSSAIYGEETFCHSHKPEAPSNNDPDAMQRLQEDCPICYTCLNTCSHVVKTHCGHLFHKHCIMTWKESSIYGSTCPLCRRNTHVSRSPPSKVQRIYTVIEEYV